MPLQLDGLEHLLELYRALADGAGDLVARKDPVSGKRHISRKRVSLMAGFFVALAAVILFSG